MGCYNKSNIQWLYYSFYKMFIGGTYKKVKRDHFDNYKEWILVAERAQNKKNWDQKEGLYHHHHHPFKNDEAHHTYTCGLHAQTPSPDQHVFLGLTCCASSSDKDEKGILRNLCLEDIINKITREKNYHLL